MELGLVGKTTIVTGGGSNIGRAIALSFAREQANVVIADIDDVQAHKVAAEGRALGSQVIVVKTDVTDNDSIVFFNFRSDRAREITKAFVQGRFNKFKRKKLLKLFFTSLVQYDSKIKTHIVFPPLVVKNILPAVLDKNKIKQLRAAETEKYAHVTYFFNYGRERPFLTEDRILVNSPRVSTYDLKPSMSAPTVARKVIEKLGKKKYGFVLLNLANPDMVGHTGKLGKTIEAVSATDRYLGRIVNAAVKNGYVVLVTADHGNAEEMIGRYKTSHTCNKVPFVLVNYNKKVKLKAGKSIVNVAPTVLNVMGVKKPRVMDVGLF